MIHRGAWLAAAALLLAGCTAYEPLDHDVFTRLTPADLEERYPVRFIASEDIVLHREVRPWERRTSLEHELRLEDGRNVERVELSQGRIGHVVLLDVRGGRPEVGVQFEPGYPPEQDHFLRFVLTAEDRFELLTHDGTVEYGGMVFRLDEGEGATLDLERVDLERILRRQRNRSGLAVQRPLGVERIDPGPDGPTERPPASELPLTGVWVRDDGLYMRVGPVRLAEVGGPQPEPEPEPKEKPEPEPKQKPKPKPKEKPEPEPKKKPEPEPKKKPEPEPKKKPEPKPKKKPEPKPKKKPEPKKKPKPESTSKKTSAPSHSLGLKRNPTRKVEPRKRETRREAKARKRKAARKRAAKKYAAGLFRVGRKPPKKKKKKKRKRKKKTGDEAQGPPEERLVCEGSLTDAYGSPRCGLEFRHERGIWIGTATWPNGLKTSWELSVIGNAVVGRTQWIEHADGDVRGTGWSPRVFRRLLRGD